MAKLQGGAGRQTDIQFSVEPTSYSIDSRILDNGKFHGVDTYAHRKTNATTGFFQLIYYPVGLVPAVRDSMELVEADERWMRRALSLAARAADLGEVPVGAVLVLDGDSVGEGFNSPIAACDPTAHAEILALRRAATRVGNYRLVDSTLYVTLEPCPMCAGALVHARVGRVVYGASDPRPGAAGTVFNVLRSDTLNHRAEVQGGVLAAACGDLLREFFVRRRGISAREYDPISGRKR